MNDQDGGMIDLQFVAEAHVVWRV